MLSLDFGKEKPIRRTEDYVEDEFNILATIDG